MSAHETASPLLTSVDALNAGCRCLAVDLPALQASLKARLEATGLPVDLSESHAHLFAAQPVFASTTHLHQMEALVEAVEAVVRLPQWQDAVLEWAPAIARFKPGNPGIYFGYDFHMTAAGPRLIEINTNAGGGLLVQALRDATVQCCPGVEAIIPGVMTPSADTLPGMLISEWRQAGRTGLPRTVAMVDASPETQYLYPEFLLARDALRHAGIEAVIVDPAVLVRDQNRLYAGNLPLDMVYNRLTDFALEAPAHNALRESYLAGAVVVTPHPRAHALYADKRNLILLSDAGWLRAAGVSEPHIAVLTAVIPPTRLVAAADAAQWWENRRQWFFKPWAGYGSKGAYRGDKLTKRVFADIMAGGYIAQALVPPGERASLDAADAPLKVDIRNYAYAGRVQQVAARLWRGQTTNFRTTGGGFAPVLALPDSQSLSLPSPHAAQSGCLPYPG